MTVTGVGRVVDCRVALVVIKMDRYLDLQRALDQHLGQLLDQAIFANQVFRFLVVGKPAVSQLDQFRILRRGKVGFA